MRYGTSYLISLIILLFVASIRKFNVLIVNKLSKILLLIIIVSFSLKQFIKIYNNFDHKYINRPWPNIYTLDDNLIHKKSKFQNFKKLNIYYSDRECAYSKSICGNYKPTYKFKIYKFLSYYFIHKKN